MICRICKKEKSDSCFSADKRAKSGKRSICRACEKAYRALHPPRNGHKDWNEYSRAKFKKHYYTPEGKEVHRIRAKEYYHKKKNDPRFKLNYSSRNTVYYMIKTGLKGKNWNTFLGYSSQELINHLQKKFDQNMSWDNYASYWEIDHIIPESLFNYTSREDNEFKKCWSLENLQPLKKEDNKYKSNKI